MLLLNYKKYHLCHLNLENSFINSNYGLLRSMIFINSPKKVRMALSYKLYLKFSLIKND